VNFILGHACWHVIGYVNGDLVRPTLLCGSRPNPDYAYGGGISDVVASGMRLCKTCDRCTQHQASRLLVAAPVDDKETQ
jgi:hypothetical protein